jgi:hypothetical protein
VVLVLKKRWSVGQQTKFSKIVLSDKQKTKNTNRNVCQQIFLSNCVERQTRDGREKHMNNQAK